MHFIRGTALVVKRGGILGHEPARIEQVIENRYSPPFTMPAAGEHVLTVLSFCQTVS
jgi:hypothetical protein